MNISSSMPSLPFNSCTASSMPFWLESPQFSMSPDFSSTAPIAYFFAPPAVPVPPLGVSPPQQARNNIATSAQINENGRIDFLRLSANQKRPRKPGHKIAESAERRKWITQTD